MLVSSPVPLVGQCVFGGYVVTHRIGKGGMGEVYQAHNPEIGKKLAIKILRHERVANADATARFLAEARAASSIQHRNIIEIVDSSTLPDGRHYILMEFLEGETLRHFAKRHLTVPVGPSLALLSQICSALQAAHDAGIVHRDIKPSNVFVSPQLDNPYFIKILDFGIAKLEDPDLARDIETQSQAVAGTPNYMAPEQARALRGVDHRADIYAVGAIAYKLLTGKTPYAASSIGDLVYQQTQGPPPPPTTHRANVPQRWSATIMRALARDPADRFDSMSEFALALTAITPGGEDIVASCAPLLLTGDSPHSSPDSSIESLSLWRKRAPLPTTTSPPTNNGRDSRRVLGTIALLSVFSGLIIAWAITRGHNRQTAYPPQPSSPSVKPAPLPIAAEDSHATGVPHNPPDGGATLDEEPTQSPTQRAKISDDHDGDEHARKQPRTSRPKHAKRKPKPRHAKPKKKRASPPAPKKREVADDALFDLRK